MAPVTLWFSWCNEAVTEARPRPIQVTVATWLGAIGAALFAIGLFDTMAATHTVAMRSSIDDFLNERGSGGLTVEGAIDAIRVAVFAGGIAAAVAFVFAFYLRRGDKAARVGFTVAAALLIPGMLAASGLGLGGMLLVLALVWLWSRPARDWFAGRAPAEAAAGADRSAHDTTSGIGGGLRSPWFTSEQRPEDQQSPSEPAGPPSAPQPEPPNGPSGESLPAPGGPPPADPTPSAGPASYPPPVVPPAAPPVPPAPAAQPGYQYGSPGAGPAYGQTYPSAYPSAPMVSAPVPGVDPDKRPAAVVWASIITWAISGLVAALGGVVLLVIAGDRASILREIRAEMRTNSQLQDLSVSAESLLNMVVGMVVVLIVWCLIAIVLGVLTFLRFNWARILLVISAGVSSLLSLITILAFAPVVPLAAGVAVIVLLFTSRSNAWFSRHPGGGSLPGPMPGAGHLPPPPSAGPPAGPPYGPPPGGTSGRKQVW